MSNFIEQQANAFADAHQKQIINKLIQIIDDELETKLETVIDKENKEYKAKYDKFIKTLKTKEEKETYKDLKPEVVTFKNEAEKFSYAFNLLLKE
jgi:rubrerythrin